MTIIKIDILISISKISLIGEYEKKLKIFQYDRDEIFKLFFNRSCQK